MAEESGTWTSVGEENLKELLGPPVYQPPDRDKTVERVGIANASTA